MASNEQTAHTVRAMIDERMVNVCKNNNNKMIHVQFTSDFVGKWPIQ